MGGTYIPFPPPPTSSEQWILLVLLCLLSWYIFGLWPILGSFFQDMVISGTFSNPHLFFLVPTSWFYADIVRIPSSVRLAVARILSSGDEFQWCELWLSLLSWSGVSHVCHFSLSGVRWPHKLDSSSWFKKQVLNGLSSSTAFFFCLHAPSPLSPQTKGMILSLRILRRNVVSMKPQTECPP